ncbi:MAG: DUF4412 domain-containing protein [Firmicutes bacterium]|nr:DUF4412 domain-containing protein [Bacillota bacterium]
MKRWLLVLLVVAMIAAGITGCSSKSPAPTNTTPPTNTQTQTGTDLSSIMKSASAVKQMSFDTISTITSSGQTTTSTGKFYMSNGRMRMETQTAGLSMITITTASSDMYLYNPDTKSAMKLTTPQKSTDLPNKWAKDTGDTTGYVVIGSEQMGGYDCLVVQYTDPANASNTTKMWLRKDIGLPVRVEGKTSDGTTIVTQYQNYVLGAQPDSLFELPSGTQITTMPSIPNLPQLPQ